MLRARASRCCTGRRRSAERLSIQCVASATEHRIAVKHRVGANGETGTANNRLTRIDVFPPGSKTASLEIPMPQGKLPIELAMDCDENSLYVSGLYSIVYGARYPLRGQTLYVKDQVSAVIQGVTMTNNLEL
jgi:hypothetical protein